MPIRYNPSNIILTAVHCEWTSNHNDLTFTKRPGAGGGKTQNTIRRDCYSENETVGSTPKLL